MAIDVDKWSTFKLILRELEKPAVKEKYHTVTIDTVSIAWALCEQYICTQNSVSELADIPWGQGFTKVQREFEACLRKITQLGYGLVIIAHEEKRIDTDSKGNEIEYVAPAIPKRCYNIVNQLVDIIAYIDVTFDEDGTEHRWLYTRRTPTIMAGSRFKYLPPKIPFGYDELVAAIGEAIDKQEHEDGAVVVNEVTESKKPVIEMSFKEIRSAAEEIWKQLVGNGETDKEKDNARVILKKAEMIFGHPIKLSEITDNQTDLFYLLLLEMQDLQQEI